MEIYSTKRCFMFHEIVDEDFNTGFHRQTKGKYSITSEAFEQIVVKYMDQATYTFDDGGRSNLIAARILEKYGLTGIFFVISDKIEQDGFLSRFELKELALKHKVASHSSKHTMGPQSFYNTRLDWSESIGLIREVNGDSSIVALPGGYFDRNIYLVLKDLGISKIYHSAPFSTFLDFWYPGLTYQPRIVVTKKFGFTSLMINSLKSLLKQLWNKF